MCGAPGGAERHGPALASRHCGGSRRLEGVRGCRSSRRDAPGSAQADRSLQAWWLARSGRPLSPAAELLASDGTGARAAHLRVAPRAPRWGPRRILHQLGREGVDPLPGARASTAASSATTSSSCGDDANGATSSGAGNETGLCSCGRWTSWAASCSRISLVSAQRLLVTARAASATEHPGGEQDYDHEDHHRHDDPGIPTHTPNLTCPPGERCLPRSRMVAPGILRPLTPEEPLSESRIQQR